MAKLYAIYRIITKGTTILKMVQELNQEYIRSIADKKLTKKELKGLLDKFSNIIYFLLGKDSLKI